MVSKTSKKKSSHRLLKLLTACLKMRLLYIQFQGNVSLITGRSKSYCGFLCALDFQAGFLKRFKMFILAGTSGTARHNRFRLGYSALPSEIQCSNLPGTRPSLHLVLHVPSGCEIEHPQANIALNDNSWRQS